MSQQLPSGQQGGSRLEQTGILLSPSLLLSLGATFLTTPAQTCPSAQAPHSLPSQHKGPESSIAGADISGAVSQNPIPPTPTCPSRGLPCSYNPGDTDSSAPCAGKWSAGPTAPRSCTVLCTPSHHRYGLEGERGQYRERCFSGAQPKG